MTIQAVVLAHAHDAGARAVSIALSERLGPHAAAVVRPESLGLAAWSHRLGPSGNVRTKITLRGGTELDSEHIRCLFNRLEYLPNPRFERTSAKDRDYACAELQALVASWLRGLRPRVINPAGPRGQALGPVTRRGWLALAAQVGLPVVRSIAGTAGRLVEPTGIGEVIRRRLDWPGSVHGPEPVEVEVAESSVTDPSDVLVVGQHMRGALAKLYGAQCREVAQRAGCPLLEFRFGRVRGDIQLLGVNPLPPLAELWAVTAVTELLVVTGNRREW